MNSSVDNYSIASKELDNSSAISTGTNFSLSGSKHGEVNAKHRASLVKWLNSLLPSLNLPKNIKDDELRECLRDGTVLCHLLNKLRPGSVNVVSDSENSENVKRFLAAVDDLGLPQFEASDLERGFLKGVVDCLLKLKSVQNSLADDNISILSLKSDGPRGEEHRKASSESKFQRVLRSAGIGNCFYTPPESSGAISQHAGQKFHEMILLKNGSYADIPASKMSEMMKSNSLENASTQYLLTVINCILDESAERKHCEIPQRAAILLRKVIHEIERRISTQAEYLRNQSNLFKARDEKYQSRIRVLEALATGTREESEMVASQLQQLMAEKILVEEKHKASEEGITRLMEEKDHINMELSTLKQELETMKITCSQLEAEAEGAKGELNQKSKEYEHLLEGLIDKVKELETSSDSKCQKWSMKKEELQNAVDSQFNAVQKIKLSWQSIVQDIMKEQKIYLEECNLLGQSLTPLADAANKYHDVLAENRRLFNEVQELKGNIRVYCRIRPFLPGSREKRSIVEHVGENDLVIVNRSKQGKEAIRSFKFNKIYGPTASQVEVYSDIQPFIRSVLDGYNACIFAYGQTGSGKTYTMSGPNGATTETYGVNYRALNDLFSISSSRTGSIVYEVWVQMVEIYNEQVRDLLSTEASQKRLGILTKSQSKGIAVPDASMFAVKSTSDVLMLMGIGLKNRAMGATAMNERSSRSHSVVSIHVRGKDLRTGSAMHGNLHLVDLAGSERVDRSEATGDRLKEAQHINKSLSALGDVISALASKSTHVPYRNSKLTQLLQSALGGHGKTLMFVQLNPDVSSYSESLSTLKFAERVSGIELGAARSSKEGKDVRELIEQVASLKDTISRKDEEIEKLQSLKDVKNVNSERASMRYGSKDVAGSTPKRDHSPARHEIFQFSKVGGGHSSHNSPARPEMFRFASPSRGATLDDFYDHGLLDTESDDLFDTHVLTENKRSPNRTFKSKPVSKGGVGRTVQNSPSHPDIFRFASSDYSKTNRLSDFPDRGFLETETDDLFDNKVLNENRKSPRRSAMKSNSKVVSKVARASPKLSQPSANVLTATKESLKKSPSMKRSTSGGQLKASASKRWQ